MEPKVITLKDLNYEQLSMLHSSVKASINEVDLTLANVKDKKASEVTHSEWNLFRKRLFLTKLKEEITELILGHASSVTLPEGLLCKIS